MFFYIPTRIISEEHCIEKNADIFSDFVGKALIVTGKSSARKTGALDDVINALNKSNISYCIFDKVKENPTDLIVEEIAELGKREKVGFIIGIGGGSPIDAAKSAAILIANPLCKKEILGERVSLTNLPVIAVPTTAGTGTEATPYASIIFTAENQKKGTAHRVFPVVSFVDPEYLKTAPSKVFNNTVADALGHLIESCLNRKATDYTKMLCNKGLELWGKAIHSYTADGMSEEVCRDFSTASTIAGMAISHAGTAIPHGLSNCLTIDYNVPHGQAVGVFLVAYLRNMPSEDAVQQILDLLGFCNLDELQNIMNTLLEKVTLKKTNVLRYVELMSCSKARNCPYIETNEVLLSFFEDNPLIEIN